MHEDKIIEKLIKHDKQFDKINKKLFNHDKQFEILVNKLLEHDERLEDIEENMATKKDMNEVKVSLEEIATIVKRLD